MSKSLSDIVDSPGSHHNFDHFLVQTVVADKYDNVWLFALKLSLAYMADSHIISSFVSLRGLVGTLLVSIALPLQWGR
jgi:hypothetical protein